MSHIAICLKQTHQDALGCNKPLWLKQHRQMLAKVSQVKAITLVLLDRIYKADVDMNNKDAINTAAAEITTNAQRQPIYDLHVQVIKLLGKNSGN